MAKKVSQNEEEEEEEAVYSQPRQRAIVHIHIPPASALAVRMPI